MTSTGVGGFEGFHVSMKSGLEGRNNPTRNTARGVGCTVVSMKSGLEGRNNND